ncbi:hypothetical protein PV326_008571 [Microctonus aethiopoides]|nr:hypothetical protein PV326_008571 [Microctonus aethiopoides]
MGEKRRRRDDDRKTENKSVKICGRYSDNGGDGGATGEDDSNTGKKRGKEEKRRKMELQKQRIGGGKRLQVSRILVYHKEHERKAIKRDGKESPKSSKRDVGVKHENGKRENERENVPNGDDSKIDCNVWSGNMGVAKSRLVKKNTGKILQIRAGSSHEHT